MKWYVHTPEMEEKFKTLWPKVKNKIKRKHFKTRFEYRKELNYQRWRLWHYLSRNPQVTFS